MIKIYLPEFNVKVTISIEKITLPPTSPPPPASPSAGTVIPFPHHQENDYGAGGVKIFKQQYKKECP